MTNIYSQLVTKFSDIKFKQEHDLAPYTTVKIGGPAEVFCETKKSKTFTDLVSYALKNKIPLTVLGWGANSLISDAGIRGLVIKNSAQDIKISYEDHNNEIAQKTFSQKGQSDVRWQSNKGKGTFKYEFEDLDYLEKKSPTVIAEIDSGVSLPYAINTLINRGITGLQWYSRIPATMGGAIYNNIHGGTHFISEVIESVKVIDKHGKIKIINKKALKAGYDTSRFHKSGEIIVSAKLKLYLGDKKKAKFVAKEWAVRKSIQPQKSLGCIFQNIDNKKKEELGLPTSSVGYIIEHIINKKGFQIGDAKVSDKHAAFIENVGHATAKDYLEVIKVIIAETKKDLGIVLKPEIFFLGFTEEELVGVTH